MNASFLEPHPPRVLEASRAGQFDELEVIGQADETEFFELCFQKKMLDSLAESMPTARKKEEVPRWFILAANLSLKLHGENSYLGFERDGRCGGLLQALDPAIASKHLDPQTQQWFIHGQGFNDKNDYERTTPCDQEFLRKVSRDVAPRIGCRGSMARCGRSSRATAFSTPRGFSSETAPPCLCRTIPAQRQKTLAERRVPAPPKPRREACAIEGFTSWSSASVPLEVVLIRTAALPDPEKDWALLTTASGVPPARLVQRYGLRPEIEERHRQLKCFYDLSDFRSRNFNAITAQMVFILLAYTLRQWQLWTLQQTVWAGLSPEQLQQRLTFHAQWVVIYHQLAYVQLPLATFTREVLELQESARVKVLAKVRKLEQRMLAPVTPLRPRPP